MAEQLSELVALLERMRAPTAPGMAQRGRALGSRASTGSALFRHRNPLAQLQKQRNLFASPIMLAMFGRRFQ